MREMKDSGIEWIGEIPKGWETRKIKYLYKLRDEKNYKSLQDVQLLSLYTELGVFPHGEQEERGNKAITAEGYKIVYENDIVVNIILAWMGAIGMSQYNGVTSPAYDIYIPYDNVANSKFYHYLFRTSMFSGECYRYGRGIMAMRWRTYSTEFKSIIVPFPTYEKQTAIANYLDDKCGKIDVTIQGEKQHIEKLKEYRQAVITEAVTKGLDPTVPMKDTDIEWIGQIPQGWEIRKITSISSSIGSGTTPKSDPQYYDGDINWLNTGDLNDNIIENIPKTITQKAINEIISLRIYPKNSIAIAMYGATIGKLGIISAETTTNQACCVITCKKDSSFKYLFYTLQAGRVNMISLSNGSGQPNINQDIVKQYKIPFPSLREQTTIANYLDHKTAHIDNAIAKKETLIEKLTEYKKSLIYEAVTGKMEVY